MVLDLASTAYMLVCTAQVQVMTPALGFFYGGLVCENSVVTMLMQVMVPMGVVSIMWYIFLFSFCFGETLHFFGNPGTYFFMADVNVNEELMLDGARVPDAVGIPGMLFVAYHGMFAVITPALMTGAFAGRFRFKPYIIFIMLWMIVVYAPWCHWVWGGGWVAEWGVWDFAGGIVVHITAGFSALASLFVVGAREAEPGENLDEPHNIPFVALGTALLWFGWFGFNGGSAMSSGGLAVAAAINSEIAASVALLVWLCIDWFRFGRPKLVGLCVGSIAGLATVTPAAGFIQPWAAFVIGVLSSVCCYACCEARKKFSIDDALDVWGVHGMGGFIGTILLGVLADPSECAPEEGSGLTAPIWCVNPGSITRSGEQLGKQALAAFFCAGYSMVVTYAMLKGINLFVPIKPTVKTAELDQHEHGEMAYSPQKTYADQSPAKGFTPGETYI